MPVLTALMTHLDAPRVHAQLDYLHALAPGSRFVVCHGGERSEFGRLEIEDAVFIEEPTLREPSGEQSHNEVFQRVHEGWVRDDPDVELAYFVEFDHLILRPDFEELLTAAAEQVGAGLMAKWAGPRDDTNWPHSLRYRDDDRVNRFFDSISRREDAGRRLGCLGNAMLFRRDALGALCALEDPPHVYVEMYVPTALHHLGFEVADFDVHGDLHMGVRWRPEFSVDEAIAAKQAGRAFVHPFKELDRLDAVLAAPGPPPQN